MKYIIYSFAALLLTTILIGGQAMADTGDGYRLFSDIREEYDFGSASFLGTTTSDPQYRVRDVSSTQDGNGAYVLFSDGKIYSYGTANTYDSCGSVAECWDGYVQNTGLSSNYTCTPPNTYPEYHHCRDIQTPGRVPAWYDNIPDYYLPFVGIEPVPADNGYWVLHRGGGVFTFGSASYFGSLGNTATESRIISMTSTPSGNGYWLVTERGSVYSFGDAQYYGGTNTTPMRGQIVDIARTPSGGGYWLVASDGGVFSFGDASFYGSAANFNLAKPITKILATSSPSTGYWLLGQDGGVFSFGGAPFYGSRAGMNRGGNYPISNQYFYGLVGLGRW